MEQLFFAGKAYLKIKSLVKTPLHEFMAVERSGLWAPGPGRLPCPVQARNPPEPTLFVFRPRYTITSPDFQCFYGKRVFFTDSADSAELFEG